jgi:rhodanese-related sulfurtransferase
MASHVAARRAVEAGYGNVSVMVDGVKGWKAAGRAVVKP